MPEDAASRRERVPQGTPGAHHEDRDLLDLVLRLGRQLPAAPVQVENPAPKDLPYVLFQDFLVHA